MDFSPILTLKTCANCKVCCVFARESLVYVPRGVEVKEQANGEFACVHRREDFGCTLGKSKPMECAAWPFSISKRGNELLLILEHSCPELNKKENLKAAKEFAINVVAQNLLEYSRNHLDSLREYDGKSLICAIW
jgi:Fe-S-cluster containining protein